MKLLVFADTHGYPKRMLEVVKKDRSAGVVFHLGDGVRDAEMMMAAVPNINLYCVRGNCDGYNIDYPTDGMATFCGLPIFYTHGDHYGVKGDLSPLWMAAKQRGAGAALYAHTHVPHFESRAGIYLFNPGSISMSRTDSATYGKITLGEGEPHFEIMRYEE